MIPVQSAPDPGILLSIIGDVKMRYQDPKIEKCKGRRDYWRIRPVVPIVAPNGAIVRRQKAIRLGYCDEMGKGAAAAVKQQIMATINGGPAVLQSQLNFAALLKRYREAGLPQLADSTQEKYRCHLDNHIEPAFRDLKLLEIDRPCVEAWLASKEHLSKATRLDLRNILSAVLEAARGWNLYSGENPAHRAKVGRGGAIREKRMLSDHQIRAFLDAIPDTHIMPSWKARTLARVALYGALRVSECLGLKWADVDLNTKTVRVVRRWRRGGVADPKAPRSARVAPIGPAAEDLRLIRQGAPEDAWVFGSPEPPDDRDLQQHVWRPAAEAVGVYHAGFGLHTLRRVSITLSQQMGMSAIEAAQRAGHARASTTALYTLTDDERSRQVVEAMGARLEVPQVRRI